MNGTCQAHGCRTPAAVELVYGIEALGSVELCESHGRQWVSAADVQGYDVLAVAL